MSSGSVRAVQESRRLPLPEGLAEFPPRATRLLNGRLVGQLVGEFDQGCRLKQPSFLRELWATDWFGSA